MLSTYFLFFMIYSFLGWFYESTICSLLGSHKLINRGYLMGPYCPIYGAGAVVNIILLQNVKNIAMIFIIAMVTCGIIEYMTSYVMEELFHARWWDYSKYPLNLQGRICMYGCVIFGTGIVFLIKVLHPFVLHLVNLLPLSLLNTCAAILFIMIVADTVFTTMRMKSFNEKLKYLHDNVNERINSSISAIADKRKYIAENLKAITSKDLTIDIENIKRHFRKSELRIFKAFPRFHSTKYSVISEKIKEFIEKK